MWFSQFKDFMSTFNQVTESCFTDCVNDFTTRRLTKQEVLIVCVAVLCLVLWLHVVKAYEWLLKQISGNAVSLSVFSYPKMNCIMYI